MCTLSVIIPIYNGENSIKPLIHSLWYHNKDIFDRLEIILVNDGSTDNSLHVCEELASEYSIIVIINKENGGIASARNEGLKRASGKYVTFCDQDDLVVKGYDSFITIIDSQRADVLFSNYVRGGIVTKSIKQECVYERDEILDLFCCFVGGGILLDVDHRNDYPTIRPGIWSCIFSLSFIRLNTIEVMRFVDYEDDWLFIVQVLSYAGRAVVSNDYYYSWTINNKSESHTHKYVKDYFPKRQKYMGWMLPILSRMGINEKKIEAFQNLLLAQTIINGFFNTSMQSYRLYKEDMKKCPSVTTSAYKYCMGKFGRFFYIILYARAKKTAYFLNHYFFKRYYH